MLRKLLISAVAFGMATSASAATLVLTNGAVTPIPPVLGNPSINDFQSQLNGLGFNNYAYTGSTLSVVAAAGEHWVIQFAYYGNENGAADTFVGGSATKTYVGGPTSVGASWVGNPGQSLNGFISGFGSTSLTGLSTLAFSTSSSGGGAAGAMVGDYGFGFFVGPNARRGDVTSATTLYFGYDDNIAIDDNHDDGVFRMTISAIPEPATWGMMIGGMGIAGMALRRRRRSSFAALV
jgi:PEP-CTERM motif